MQATSLLTGIEIFLSDSWDNLGKVFALTHITCTYALSILYESPERSHSHLHSTDYNHSTHRLNQGGGGGGGGVRGVRIPQYRTW